MKFSKPALNGLAEPLTCYPGPLSLPAKEFHIKSIALEQMHLQMWATQFADERDKEMWEYFLVDEENSKQRCLAWRGE